MNRNRPSALILSAFCAPLLISTAFADEALTATPSQAPVQVNGDAVEYFHEEEKVVGTGHVSIDYEGVKLTADKITLFMKTSVGVAEGNVILVQEGSLFKGQRAEYNFKTKEGRVDEMAAEIEPSLYGKAKKIEKAPDGHTRALDGYVTTCCGDSPFYRVQGKQVDIYPKDRVVVRNAMLVVKGVPILFMPYYSQRLYDFDRFPVQIIPGKNSEWGAFLLSKWRYELARSGSFQSKGNILADYREKRGFGGGVENFYRGDMGRGAARVFFTEDDNPPVEADESRYRGQWRHQSKLTPDTTLTAEINKLSDSSVIKDFFFREEYERNAVPDNYVSLITAKPEYTFSLLDRERLDDFMTVVERSPELRFDTHNRRLGETPFYFREEMQASNLKKEFAGSEDQQDALRLDSNYTLSYAGHTGDVSLTPHVGTRQTYFSRGLVDGEDRFRGTLDAGLDASVHFYRTIPLKVRRWGLDYNDIRHIFSPSASWNYRPNPTVPLTVLQQFDALDAIDKQNFIRFDFENKFWTKEHLTDGSLQSREIARIIPFTDLDLHTGQLDNVGIDVELRPYSWLGIESDATYDVDTDDVDTANLDVSVTRGPATFAVGQRYARDDSNQTTLDARWRINEEWEAHVYERYDFQDGDSEEFEITLSKIFDCVILDVTYNHRDGDSIFVVLRLKGYPGVSFGLSQSYNSPKSSAGRLL